MRIAIDAHPGSAVGSYGLPTASRHFCRSIFLVAMIATATVDLLLEKACSEGNDRLDRGDFQYSENSGQNEKFVVEVLRDVAPSVGIEPKVIVHLGGKSFPDIHISGTPIGIELKGSLKGGAITGNSIFSGSMVENLEKVYLLYWINDRTPKLGYRDYFDCVFDAKVTHSPRFALRVDLPAGESMFGTGTRQLGFDASDWLRGEEQFVDRIVLEIRRRALERKEIPWWVVTDDNETIALEPDNRHGLGGLRFLKGIERQASFSLQKTLFLGFPEVLSGGSDAHSLAVGWSISQRSVIVNRDIFSAGGRRKIDIGLPGGVVDFPAVIGNCSRSVSRNVPVSLTELSSIHGLKFSSGEDVIRKFQEMLGQPTLLDYLADCLTPAQRALVTTAKLKSALIEFLTQLIDPQTII
jgi:hypothetical protein